MVLHLPWAGSFTKSFSLFTLLQFLRWPQLLGRRKNSQPGWIVRLHFYSVIWLLNNGVTGLSPALRARLDSQVLCLPCRKQEISAAPILTPYRMALHRGNLAPTTHSLTPKPFYRPTLFRPVGTSEKARSDRLCRAL